MKLLLYELRKLVSKRSFLLCLLLCSIFVLFFAYSNVSSKQIYVHHKAFNHLILKNVSIEENYEYLVKRNDDLQMAINQKKILNELFQQGEEKPPVEDVNVKIEAGMSEEESLAIASEALQYVENIKNYNQYNANIAMSDLNEAIKSDYQNVNQENIRTVNFLPLESVNGQYVVFILSVFVCLFAIYSLNTYEKETNTEGICYLSVKGKQNLVFSKLFAGIIVGISITLLFNLCLLLINFCVFGLSDLNANIQSIPSCYESPFNISILMALIIGMGKQMIVIACFICVYYLIYSFVKKDTVTTIFLFLFLALEFVLYHGISDYASLVVFKKWNLFNLASFFSFMDTYDGITVFGLEINSLIFFVLAFFILLACLIVRLYVYSKGWVNSSKRFALNVDSKRGTHINLWLHETYKQLVLGKGTILLVVLISCCIYVTCNFAMKMQNMNFTAISKQYQKYGGELTDAKRQTIQSKYSDIETRVLAFRTVDSQYRNGEISEVEYREIEDKFMTELYDDRVFENFYEDYQKSIGNSIVFPNGFQAVFSVNTYDRDITYSALLIFIAVLLFSGLYCVDKEQDQEKLYRLTKHGRRKRLLTQRRIGYIWIAILSVVLILFTFLLFYFVYPMDGWNYETTAMLRTDTNVEIINDNYVNSSLLVNFIKLQIFRVVVLLIGFELTLSVSQIIRSRKNTVIILLIVVLLPFMLTQIGFQIFRYVSLIHLLSANIIFHTSNGSVLIYAIIIYVLLRMIGNEVVKRYSKTF